MDALTAIKDIAPVHKWQISNLESRSWKRLGDISAVLENTIDLEIFVAKVHVCSWFGRTTKMKNTKYTSCSGIFRRWKLSQTAERSDFLEWNFRELWETNVCGCGSWPHLLNAWAGNGRTRTRLKRRANKMSEYRATKWRPLFEATMSTERFGKLLLDKYCPASANFFFGPTLDLVSGAKCFYARLRMRKPTRLPTTPSRFIDSAAI